MGEVNDEILHEHLKNLIEGSTKPWTYAILWQFSCDFPLRLKFQSGCYRDTGKAKEARILGSSVSVTDAEWFFKISTGQSLGFTEDLPGLAFCDLCPVWVNAADTNASTSSSGQRHKWGMWERTKWGHQFGIQTFLCLSLTESRVLELASTQIMRYDPEWIKDMTDLIRPIGTLPDLEKIFRKDKKLRGRADNEMQNRGNDNSSKQSRGKEKISDSKCSWSLLTASSDRGTDTISYSHDYSGPS